jgi:mannose-1-phosphate guanylyltransferase
LKDKSSREKLSACAVLLAGGRGTRFWPRSRMRTPKQLLNITGKQTMLLQTASRLWPLVAPRNIWVVTNVEQVASVRRELPGVPSAHILAEPVGRNTAAAIALAAIHLKYRHGDALMAVLPSDSYIANTARYRKLVSAALDMARNPGSLVVLGIPPTRPETGYGYIERGDASRNSRGVIAYDVRRFAEKPAPELAREYVASKKYFWNAGMFFWRVSTYLENLQRFLPATHDSLLALGRVIGKPGYSRALRRIYPKLQNISVDYAVMEPATQSTGSSRVFVIPAEVGWSDIGSWAAVYELLAAKEGGNVSAGPSFTVDADANYFWSPRKFVAAVGISNIVFVETDDAVLLCSRERSQEVGKIVKWLEEQKNNKLL